MMALTNIDIKMELLNVKRLKTQLQAERLNMTGENDKIHEALKCLEEKEQELMKARILQTNTDHSSLADFVLRKYSRQNYRNQLPGEQRNTGGFLNNRPEYVSASPNQDVKLRNKSVVAELDIDVSDIATFRTFCRFCMTYDSWFEFQRRRQDMISQFEQNPIDVENTVHADGCKCILCYETPIDSNMFNAYRRTEHVRLIQKTDFEYSQLQRVLDVSTSRQFLEAQIQAIHGVHNHFLYGQFAGKKRFMNNNKHRFLWHGTNQEFVNHINHYGFDSNYATMNKIGDTNGIYFVNKAEDAVRYTSRDRNGCRTIYICAVLTGDYTKNLKTKSLPRNYSSRLKYELYDSHVDNEMDPKEFVIFNASQVYPLYAICFKLKDEECSIL